MAPSLRAILALCLTIPGLAAAQDPTALCTDSTASSEARADACVAAAKKNSRDGAAHRRAGDALRWAGRSEDAIASYRQALKIDATDSEARHSLGHILSHLDRDDEALREWRVIVAAEPRNVELRADVIGLLAYLERADTVAIELEALRRALPDSAEAMKEAGDALYNVSMYADAIPYFERAIVLDSLPFVRHTDLGYTLAELDRVDEAVTAFNRGLAIVPRDTAARRKAAQFLVRAGRAGEGSAQFDTLARLSPYDPIPLRLKGDALLGAERFDEAIVAYREAVTRDPSVSAAHYDLAAGLLSAGQLENALTEYDIAIRLDSTSASAHNDRGVALEQLGRMEESADAYGRAAALDSTVQLFEINSVMGAFRAGRQEEGQRLAARFASRDTTSAYRYAVHAEMMVQLREPDAAIASAERAIRLDADLLEGYMQLGVARMLKDDGPGADAAFSAGLARDSTAARLWVLRGMLHNALEKHDVAMQYWERARSLAPEMLEEPTIKPYYEAAMVAAKGEEFEVREP